MRLWTLVLALLVVCFSQTPDMRCVIHAESLQYPELARSARIQGDVRVRLKLDRRGKVVSATPVSGHPLLGREAGENVKQWVFSAGEEGELEVVYQFRLEEPRLYYRPPTKVTFDFPDQISILSSLPLPSHSR